MLQVITDFRNWCGMRYDEEVSVPYVLIVLLIVFSVLFYRVAKIDGRHGLTWATLSIAFGGFAHSMLGWGTTGFCFAQGLVFAAMFATNRGDHVGD